MKNTREFQETNVSNLQIGEKKRLPPYQFIIIYVGLLIISPDLRARARARARARGRKSSAEKKVRDSGKWSKRRDWEHVKFESWRGAI